MDGNTAAGSHHFIGSRWVASSTGQTIDVVCALTVKDAAEWRLAAIHFSFIADPSGNAAPERPS